MPTPAIYCADIGANHAKAKKFGWWSNREKPSVDGLKQEVDLEQYQSLSKLAAAVAEELRAGHPVALGFECPLFIPLREKEDQLTKGRPEDGNRPWSAGAGCGSLTTGLVQVAWVLREIRRTLDSGGRSSEVKVFLDPEKFEEANHGLLLWEAFVSWKKPAGQKGQKSRKPKDPLEHIRDASRAVEQFKSPCRCEPPRSITIEPVYSLVGAALLRSGWSEDLDLLKKACVIVRTCKDPESCAKEAAGE